MVDVLFLLGSCLEHRRRWRLLCCGLGSLQIFWPQLFSASRLLIENQRNVLSCPPGCHCGIFFFFYEARICTSFLWIVEQQSLLGERDILGFFSRGASDFFWLGRFWMARWGGITVVLQWSKFSAARAPQWGCSISCRGRCFKETFLQEWAKCQNTPELVVPANCSTLHLKLIWHFNW